MPVEPTSDMLKAAGNADSECNTYNLGADATAEEHWAVMIQVSQGNRDE